MKKLTILLSLLMIVGCGPLKRIQKASLPIVYDNATISVTSYNVILFPQPPDSKELLKALSSRLADVTKIEIANQGNLKLTSECGPRTMKIIQEITGISANTVTDVSTGFFVFQLFHGSATSTKSDVININTTATIVDCESGKTLGTYQYQGSGQNPVAALQSAAFYNVWYAYDNQRGKE